MTGHSTTAVVNARIFTAAGLTEPRTVLIHGRHIVESGTPTTQFNAEGNTLLPGLIDAHLHAFRGAADLEDLTDCGITTGLDMGLWPVENISALRSAHGVTDIRSDRHPERNNRGTVVSLMRIVQYLGCAEWTAGRGDVVRPPKDWPIHGSRARDKKIGVFDCSGPQSRSREERVSSRIHYGIAI